VLRADTVAEITEPFAGVPAAREVGEEWLEGVGDIRERDLVEQAVAQPRPLEVTTGVKRIVAGHAPDNTDVAGVRPGGVILGSQSPIRSDPDRVPSGITGNLLFGYCLAAADRGEQTVTAASTPPSPQSNAVSRSRVRKGRPFALCRLQLYHYRLLQSIKRNDAGEKRYYFHPRGVLAMCLEAGVIQFSRSCRASPLLASAACNR
jgi:hypothetical protein